MKLQNADTIDTIVTLFASDVIELESDEVVTFFATLRL